MADFDGDIDRELAVANQSSDNVTILRNNLGLDFTVASTAQAGDGPSAIAAADFDGDGDIDLAVANGNSHNVTILRKRSRGKFHPAELESNRGGKHAHFGGSRRLRR